MLPSTSLCLEWRPLLAQQQVLRRGGGHTHFTDEDSVRQGFCPGKGRLEPAPPAADPGPHVGTRSWTRLWGAGVSLEGPLS